MQIEGFEVRIEVDLSDDERFLYSKMLHDYKGDMILGPFGGLVIRFGGNSLDDTVNNAKNFLSDVEKALTLGGKKEASGEDPSLQKVDSLLGLLRELPPGGKPVQ
jgi:hypothetical protein